MSIILVDAFVPLDPVSYLFSLCCLIPTEKEGKDTAHCQSLRLKSSMFSIRLALLLVLLVLTQAESKKNNNYIRGEKVNPASRIVNGGSHEGIDNKNDLLEFQTVTRLSGSQPAQDGAKFKKTQWF